MARKNSGGKRFQAKAKEADAEFLYVATESSDTPKVNLQVRYTELNCPNVRV
jgi:hypothetical protein